VQFSQKRKEKRRKGLTAQLLSPRPPSPFISSHMSLAHLVINMEEIRGLRDATSLCSFSFPSTLVSILPPFPPCPFSYPKNRSLSLLSSFLTFHPSRSWNSQNTPLSPYWTTSLFSTPSLLKILLYLTYFSHRLIHSFFLLRISYFQFIFCYTPFAVYGQCYFPLSV